MLVYCHAIHQCLRELRTYIMDLLLDPRTQLFSINVMKHESGLSLMKPTLILEIYIYIKSNFKEEGLNL